MKKYQNHLIIAAIVLVVAAFIGFRIWQKQQPAPNDALAQCLADKGAKFYGAYWCPHCQAQKEAFGNSARLLPYIECAATGNSQTQECTDAGVKSYPTWVFADGSRVTGEQTLTALAQKTNCQVSQ